MGVHRQFLSRPTGIHCQYFARPRDFGGISILIKEKSVARPRDFTGIFLPDPWDFTCIFLPDPRDFAVFRADPRGDIEYVTTETNRYASDFFMENEIAGSSSVWQWPKDGISIDNMWCFFSPDILYGASKERFNKRLLAN